MTIKALSRGTLIAAGLASGAAFAESQDLPYVYGRIDMSINSTELGEGGRTTNTNSNASRLGVQNTHALQDGLSVFYRLEYEVNPDERLRSSDRGMLRQRNSVIGLKGGFGKVFFGVHDTPMKKAELKVDLFSDYHLADIDEVLAGQDRTSDTISYVSPEFSGFKGWLMLIPGDDASGEPGEDAGGGADAVSGDGVADGISGSLTYRGKDLQAALAYNSDVDGLDLIRISAQYGIGPVTLGALLQQAELTEGQGEDGIGFVISGALKLTPVDVLKLQFTDADDSSVEASPGSSMVTLGWDRKLAKSTKLYAYYSARSNDDPEEEFSTIGLGIQHKFGKDK